MTATATRLPPREAKAPATCEPAIADPAKSAKVAGLRYVSDTAPGIRREAAKDGFRYIAPDGSTLADPEQLTRIKKLAVPPAWTDVWICPRVNGHLQATGRDQRGRKQYRYHPRWREVRDDAKYDRMLDFAEMLPSIRDRIDEHLALQGLPREKVLATVVRLMESTLIRIGNEEYARTNQSYGLTTMTDDHVEVNGAKVSFTFRGKSGKDHSIDVRDRKLAAIVRRCRDLEGYDLFQYIDEGGAQVSIGSGDVNAYLREITGQEFTAKDFRTWGGTLLMATALSAYGPPESPTQGKKIITEAIGIVSQRLGNTPTICRKCYVHPGVLDAYLEGDVIETKADPARQIVRPLHELADEEAATLRLLRERAGASS